jgi:DNA-binding transcriptional ArsR family regulator
LKELAWDIGTTYDLFVSLNVLNRPVQFGLRPSWAAGVRSRLPVAQRQFMESLSGFFYTPLEWIHNLPPTAKAAGEAVRYINALPSTELLARFTFTGDTPANVVRTLTGIAESHQATLSQRALLQKNYFPGEMLTEDARNRLITAWEDVAAFGDGFKAMLTSYYESFFAEEEARIQPILSDALNNAQQKAKNVPLPDLLDELSHGVKLEKVFTQPGIILVPSYWSSPLIIYRPIRSDQVLMLFGCRPSDQTLIPGDVVPDQILGTLKALADPTRLQMLRYLKAEPMTASALSRKLRLRPPTVTHHLQQLRLAGLVQIILEPDGEKKYALRAEALKGTQKLLEKYISGN